MKFQGWQLIAFYAVVGAVIIACGLLGFVSKEAAGATLVAFITGHMMPSPLSKEDEPEKKDG